MKTERLEVRKTYKLYIGGAFPRSESGRSYPVLDKRKQVLARPARASRKDLRDAFRAARAAWRGWSEATAFNRGQVLYRVAELMGARTFLCFGPDTLVEATNRGYRACTKCEGVRAALGRDDERADP